MVIMSLGEIVCDNSLHTLPVDWLRVAVVVRWETQPARARKLVIRVEKENNEMC